MKLVIDISDEAYDWLVNGFPDEEDGVRLLDIVKNGTPLSESEDCVSRQAVEDAITEYIVNGESLGYAVAYDISSELPSVNPVEKLGQSFEGMTNGEVLGTLFPVISMRLFDEVFELEWWKAPYKGDY